MNKTESPDDSDRNTGSEVEVFHAAIIAICNDLLQRPEARRGSRALRNEEIAGLIESVRLRQTMSGER